MKLKLIATLLFFVASLSANVNARPTIGLEFHWGFGNSAKHEGTSKSKYCKNRSWSSLKGFGLYASDDNLELHVSKHSHDADAEGCNRSNWAIGIGPKLSTKDDGEQKDLYAEWSPGIAYRFKETWRDHGNLSLYNRFRFGAALDKNSSRQTSLEAGVLQYGGFFEPNHGESFFTFGISTSDVDRYLNTSSPTSTETDSGDTSGDNTSTGDGDTSGDNTSTGDGDGSDGDITIINNNNVTIINNNTNTGGDNTNTGGDNTNTGGDNTNTGGDNTNTGGGDSSDDSGSSDDSSNDDDSGSGDKDKGHGNDEDGHDEDNPGKSKGKNK